MEVLTKLDIIKLNHLRDGLDLWRKKKKEDTNITDQLVCNICQQHFDSIVEYESHINEILLLNETKRKLS